VTGIDIAAIALALAILGVAVYTFARAHRVADSARLVAAEQAALRRVAMSVATNPDDALAAIADEATTLTGAYTALVAEFGGGGAVHATAARNTLSPYAVSDFSVTGDGALAVVARTGEPARIDDYRSLPSGDPVRQRGAWTKLLGSAVAVPVHVGGRLWGALLVVHGKPHAFAPDTESRLASFADLVVTAISSAEAHRELTRQASTDPLTGLANRRVFEDRLEIEAQRAARGGHPLSLVLLDIDHFKVINDAHGHGTGDTVLVELGRRLGSLVRTQDLLARIGGEEFAWLITDADESVAAAVAERARCAIAGQPFEGVGPVTISAGACDLEGAPNAGGLLHGADVALYWAKENGRDRCARYSQVRHEQTGTPSPAI
jgi:diguanylate cyclase (GGDEF)-like protein